MFLDKKLNVRVFFISVVAAVVIPLFLFPSLLFFLQLLLLPSLLLCCCCSYLPRMPPIDQNCGSSCFSKVVTSRSDQMSLDVSPQASSHLEVSRRRLASQRLWEDSSVPFSCTIFAGRSLCSVPGSLEGTRTIRLLRCNRTGRSRLSKRLV